MDYEIFRLGPTLRTQEPLLSSFLKKENIFDFSTIFAGNSDFENPVL